MKNVNHCIVEDIGPLVNSQHVLVVFAETPGANYGLAQFFHQDQDGDDHDHDHDGDDLMMVTMCVW